MRQNYQNGLHIYQNNHFIDESLYQKLLGLFAESGKWAAGDIGFDQAFLECLRRICDADGASIWKLNEASRLELVLSTDITSPEDIKKVRRVGLTKGKGISGLAALQRKTMTYSAYEDLGLHDGEVDKTLGRKTLSMISSPIVWGARSVYGVLNVVNVAEGPSVNDLAEIAQTAAALYAHALIHMDRYAAPSNDEVAGRYPFLVYKHDGPFAPVVESCEKYAPYDDTVLLLGETGSGKELLARVVYEASKRTGPFLTMNCGASRRELIADELFGHVEGAYTDARKDTNGFLGDVGTGTLFLDEIGALPLECQPALLRVLDKGEYNRIGETEKRQFKGRIIAATQLSLEDKVRNGQFIEDLAYRLGRFVVRVPALRESKEDIPLLMDHFFTEGAQKYNKTRPVLSAKAKERFLSYFWPGNVRQMQSVISDALVSYSGGELDERSLEDLLKRHTWISPSTASHERSTPQPQETTSFEERFREACNNPENRTKGTKRIINKKVAECMGIDRHKVEEWLEKLNIS